MSRRWLCRIGLHVWVIRLQTVKFDWCECERCGRFHMFRREGGRAND